MEIYIPYKCPACPEKHYYGVLVLVLKDKTLVIPKCDNCKRALVPVKKG